MNSKGIVLRLVLALGIFLTIFTSHVQAQTMSVAPDMINLNAQGNWVKVQCFYPLYLPAGYTVSSHEVAVYFGGDYVTQAYHVWYCTIDDNLFVYVDRETIQNSEVVQALANLGPVEVQITGSFTATDGQGNSIDYAVDRWGYVTIFMPGKKK